jgi:hypothetical protein
MLGNMTLHLTADQFDQLAQSFGRATARKQIIDHRISEKPTVGTLHSKLVH